MGKINLLKNGYRGKVGQTVGQQWNGQLTLRTHNDHNTSKTEAQLQQRENFKSVINFSKLSYPLEVNLIPPKKWPGTKWNFFSNAMVELLKGNLNLGGRNIIGDYKWSNIMLPFFMNYNGKVYAYIYKKATTGSLNPNHYQLAGIPVVMDNSVIPNDIELPRTGEIINKSLVVKIQGQQAQKGFLLEVIAPPIQVVPYMLAIQGKGIANGRKSTFSIFQVGININDQYLVDN